MFCRAFLSDGYSGGFGKDECQSSGDCPAADCVEGTPELGGGVSGEEGRAGADSGAGAGAKAECVRGRCACQFGFHHIALDVGLEREEVVNHFKVVDADLEERGVGLWTEVNWKNIVVEVFLDPGKATGKVAVGLSTIDTAVTSFGLYCHVLCLGYRES
ncbi:unnamed protein product [Sphacelaria rigidula]